MRRIGSAVMIALFVVAGAACGDDDSSSATTVTTTTVAATNPGPVSSASAELCQAREQLRTSITDLSNVDVVKNGVSAITDQLDQIRSDLAAVKSAAGSDLRPQLDAFEQALDSLQTAVSGSGSAQDIVAGVREVATTGATLLRSLQNLSCS